LHRFARACGGVTQLCPRICAECVMQCDASVLLSDVHQTNCDLVRTTLANQGLLGCEPIINRALLLLVVVYLTEPQQS
jgi:hypothetical protein